MIAKFVARFDANREALKAKFMENHPGYSDIVKAVVSILSDPDDYHSPDPDRITVIDHGDYQGTMLFVIGAEGYQPNKYWYVYVFYGSCSVCDTLQSIRDCGSEVSEDQANSYLTLALHIVQGLKEME